jgi:hypothetical protein
MKRPAAVVDQMHAYEEAEGVLTVSIAYGFYARISESSDDRGWVNQPGSERANEIADKLARGCGRTAVGLSRKYVG